MDDPNDEPDRALGMPFYISLDSYLEKVQCQYLP